MKLKNGLIFEKKKYCSVGKIFSKENEVIWEGQVKNGERWEGKGKSFDELDNLLWVNNFFLLFTI